jgi:phosphoribosylformimino-5-aminoimidazole carboxamide ribotide isomerase
MTDDSFESRVSSFEFGGHPTSDATSPTRNSKLETRNFRLIPVLDVMNGAVVRGIGGRRSEYLPIVSALTPSTDPIGVARAIIEHIRPGEIYLADLDAIDGKPPALGTYRAILALGVRLWVDAGICNAQGARAIGDAGCDVVAGLETVPNVAAFSEIVRTVGADRVVFSLDLRNGVPLREWAIHGQDRNLIPRVVAAGITRLIVLDLARVGCGEGVGTETLCRQISSTYPNVEVIAGGGVSGTEDLARLAACGVQGVLVASALHDGRIGVGT